MSVYVLVNDGSINQNNRYVLQTSTLLLLHSTLKIIFTPSLANSCCRHCCSRAVCASVCDHTL